MVNGLELKGQSGSRYAMGDGQTDTLDTASKLRRRDWHRSVRTASEYDAAHKMAGAKERWKELRLAFSDVITRAASV